MGLNEVNIFIGLEFSTRENWFQLDLVQYKITRDNTWVLNPDLMLN